MQQILKNIDAIKNKISLKNLKIKLIRALTQNVIDGKCNLQISNTEYRINTFNDEKRMKIVKTVEFLLIISEMLIYLYIFFSFYK